jgi:hypothetical protein
MANIYVRSTDGNNADNGSTWALAKADIHTTAWAAGSRIFVSDAHAPSIIGTNMVIASGGTLAAPTQILCGDDAAEPPTSLATTAEVSTSGVASISVTGHCYVYGITFKPSSGGSSAVFAATVGTGTASQRYKNCSFQIVGSGSGGRIAASGASQPRVWVEFDDCTYKFAAAGQGIAVANATLLINGGSVLSGGTSPTALFHSYDAGRPGSMLISGFDMSNCSAGVHIFNASNHSGVIRNSKLPASWTGALTTGSLVAGARYEMHNCDSSGADTNYRLWVEDYAGSIKSETTVVRTGGASDGTTTLSWKMASSANAEYPLIVLDSPEIAQWNDTTGSSITATVEIVTDNVTLNDDECWLEVQYLGTSGYPISSFISDCKSDVLASAAAQTSSSETWTTTGLTTPVKQALSVSFTPQEKGYIHAVVHLSKASTTVYVDPKITVT